MVALFHYIDRDGSGAVDFEELCGMLRPDGAGERGAANERGGQRLNKESPRRKYEYDVKNTVKDMTNRMS